MSIHLSKQELERIKSFRYKTNGLTPLEVHIFEPYWNFIANNCLPDWLAPNLMTIGGLLVPICAFATIGYFSQDFSAFLPAWVWILCFAGLFWYQTVDAVDGKQARRTDNCSPLGQLLDHNLDQISFTIFMCHACAMIQTGGDVWRILALVPGVMAAHYSIEYRTHFTGFHATVVGFIGATEQLCTVMGVTLWAAYLSAHGTTLKDSTIELFYFGETTYADLVIFGSCVSGV